MCFEWRPGSRAGREESRWIVELTELTARRLFWDCWTVEDGDIAHRGRSVVER